jgi:hypothetical protein
MQAVSKMGFSCGGEYLDGFLVFLLRDHSGVDIRDCGERDKPHGKILHSHLWSSPSQAALRGCATFKPRGFRL